MNEHSRMFQVDSFKIAGQIVTVIDVQLKFEPLQFVYCIKIKLVNLSKQQKSV